MTGQSTFALLALAFLALHAGLALDPAVAAAATPAGATAGNADKSLTIDGFAQVRWQYDHIGARGETPSTETNYFRLRRLRLRATADWNQYYRVRLQLALQEFARLLQAQPASELAGPVLEDAYFQYKRAESFALLFGQYKLPISREELRSSSDQLVVDRSPIVNANFARSLWISRDIGLMYQGNFYERDIPLEVYGGVWNGEGRNAPLDFRDANDAKLFGGRAEYAVLPGVEIAGSYLANPVLAGGGLYSFGSASFAIPEDRDYSEMLTCWGLDGNITRQLANGRVIVEGEVLNGTNTRTYAREMSEALADTTGPALPSTGDPGFTQRGMQIAGNVLLKREGWLKGWDVGARLANYDPDVDADENSDTELAVALGLHFLEDPDQNKDRLQFEFTSITHERAGYASDWSAKAQWQVRY
jgi:hypothetical protein